MKDIEILKPGDACPCCGQPILTNDINKLVFLTWMKALYDEDDETESILANLIEHNPTEGYCLTVELPRKRRRNTVNIKLGQEIKIAPVTFGPGDGSLRETNQKTMKGRVVYIHPAGRYHTVEFDHGVRESFLGVSK